MPSGSRVAISVTGIALGIVTIIGGLAGTLAAALAGLFDPYILGPATSASLGLPPVIPPFSTEPNPPPGGEPGTSLQPPVFNGPSLGPGTTPALPPGEPPAIGGGGFFGELPA